MQIEVVGLTEICGKKGSGRTNIAISHSLEHNTLYVTSTIFPIRRYLQMKGLRGAENKCFFISEIRSIHSLWFLVKYKLDDFVRDNGIGLVIVDSLDHLLHTERKSKELYGRLTDMVKDLKNCINRNVLDVLVVNCLRKSRKIGAGEWILGLSWSYLINTRILVRRTWRSRVLKVVISTTGSVYMKIFSIDESGVIFSEDGFGNG